MNDHSLRIRLRYREKSNSFLKIIIGFYRYKPGCSMPLLHKDAN